MIFIETAIFSRQLTDYLSDEEYQRLQSVLLEKPDVGVLIPATGGLRKLRFAAANKGKRGGIRVVYYWNVRLEHIYFMTLYAKNEMSDLSAKEKTILKKMLERWLA